MLGTSLAKPTPLELAAMLPSVAAERLLRFSDAVAEKASTVSATGERVYEAARAAQDADATVVHWGNMQGRPLSEDNTRVKEQRAIAASKRGEQARLQQKYDEGGAVLQTLRRHLNAMTEWVSSTAHTGTFAVVEPDLGLKPKETLVAALDRVQRRGRELQADLNRVRSAPRHSAWAKAKVREQIAALAERGRPSVGGVIEHGQEIAFGDTMKSARVRGTNDGPALAQWTEPDLLALIAWLHKGTLVAALDREIEAEADDAAALSDVERKRQEVQLLGDIEANARVEAELCWRLIAEGATLTTIRAGMPAAALLGCELVAVPVGIG